MKIIFHVTILFCIVVVMLLSSGCTSTNNQNLYESIIIPTNTIQLNETLIPTSVDSDLNRITTATTFPEEIFIDIQTQVPDKELLISSPLQGFDLEELEKINSNPFLFLGPGKDEGHHGTDFSFYQYKNFSKIEELPVQSIFSGNVSSFVHDRPPYGNMIIIETPLSDLPDYLYLSSISDINFVDLPNSTNLNCPGYSEIDFKMKLNALSLYVLYAHLYEPPEFGLNQTIHSGDLIGKVGNTGASGNPHLHLEFRVGPTGVQFNEMAHYDNGATPEEMLNYCIWRVSGYFFQVDPMQFIQTYLQNR